MVGQIQGLKGDGSGSVGGSNDGQPAVVAQGHDLFAEEHVVSGFVDPGGPMGGQPTGCEQIEFEQAVGDGMRERGRHLSTGLESDVIRIGPSSFCYPFSPPALCSLGHCYGTRMANPC